MSHLYERVVEAAHYLQSVGMTDTQLTSLHHRSKESFNSLFRYWSVNREPHPKTLDYANRVLFIAHEHKTKNRSLSTLVEDALRKWPLRNKQRATSSDF